MLFSKLVELLKKGDCDIKDYNLFGDPEINQAESLEKAGTNQISFLEHDSYLLNSISNTQASSILIPDIEEIKLILNGRSISWAAAKYPKLAFAEVLEILNPKIQLIYGIHKNSTIEKDVKLAENVNIGANVYVGRFSSIGSNCIIHPGAIIYNNVHIGCNTEVHANAVIHPNSSIGENCIIHSNVVIGSEGFGFIPTKSGWRKMPQIGKVLIGNNVEIGSCSTIDRPAVGETSIGDGTKLDNLVQIGHGVKIGKNCAMAAQVGIAGGAVIEDGVILAGQVGVANRVKVGKGVIASSKCGVVADIEPGQVISGFPAIPNRLWLRCSANFKKLPELAKSIRDISRSNRNNF